MTLPRATRAFTLLELLLVLAVVAVLAGFVVPRLGGSLKSQRLDAQVRTVIALARKARALAAAEGRSYQIVFLPSEKSVRLARQRDPLAAPDDAADPEREALATDAEWARPLPFEDEVVLEEVLGPDGALLDLTAEFTIRFAPDGTADEHELGFRAGDLTQRLLIEPRLGRARLLRPEELP